MQSNMTAMDVVAGLCGIVTVIINKEVITLANVKSFEATAKKKKTAFKVLGDTTDRNKAGGISYTGKATLRFNTSILRKLMEQYQNTGVDTYCTMIVENYDPTSEIGRQTIQYNNINFDDSILSKIDVGVEVLEENVNFTFDTFVTIDTFDIKKYAINL